MPRWKRTRSILAFLVFGVACSSPTASEAPAPLSTTTYRLVRFDDVPLPVDLGPYPSRFPGQSTCHRLVTDGALALDVERGRYIVYYSERNSCRGHLTNQAGAEGDFDPTRDPLLLRRFVFDGTEHRLTANVDGDRVAVDFFQDHALVFASPDTSTFQPSGVFELVRIEEGPIPFGPGGDSGLGDVGLHEIQQASLRLEPVVGLAPWTGRFTLDFESSNESGTYEQIGRVLRFRAEISSNVVHLFRGMVRDGGIELYSGGNPTFVFE